MGWDIHFYLERKVMTKDSRALLSTFQKCKSLPSEIVRIILSLFAPDFEWLPVKLKCWLPLPEVKFVNASESYYDKLADDVIERLEDHFKETPHIGEHLNMDLVEECITQYAQSWIAYIKAKRGMPSTLKDKVPFFEIYNAEMEQYGDDPTEMYRVDDDSPSPPLFRFWSAMRERDYTRFALFSAHFETEAEQNINTLPCMIEGVPDDVHPAYKFERVGDSIFAHCYLDNWQQTDWDKNAFPDHTRRSLMGDCLSELDSLVQEIKGAAPLTHFRLLVSFDG